jgi:Uncharacterized conserved protein (DUF2190)
MADYAPVYGRPQSVTFLAGGSITAGRLVVVSAADTVVEAGVNGAPIGVAGHDAASGAKVTVLMGSGVVHETNAAVAFPAAGVPVYAGATGGATPTAGTGPIIGYALRTALQDALIRWKAVA